MNEWRSDPIADSLRAAAYRSTPIYTILVVENRQEITGFLVREVGYRNSHISGILLKLTEGIPLERI